MDKRNEKTQYALYSAFMQITRANPQEKVKISDLCAASEVTRATFYNNYKNMADFVADAEWRMVKRIINDVPAQSYTFDNPQLFTTELTLAFMRNRQDVRLLFKDNDIVRMLYLLEKGVKQEIFNLNPLLKDNRRMNVILTYCIMGAANAIVCNPGIPHEVIAATVSEIVQAIKPLMRVADE